MSDKVGILIAARTASSRLPRKALIKIGPKESIVLLIERLKTCTRPSEIILCTTEGQEDHELAAVARREGVKVFRGDRENVAQRLLNAAHEHQLDHFVRVTGDDILRCTDLIDEAIESHIKNKADYTYMKNVFYGGDSEIISIHALNTVVTRAEEPENTEYLSWYLENEDFFKTNFIDAGRRYWRPYRLSLDTPEDLMVMNAVHQQFYQEGRPVDILEALKWLDKNPQITALNSQVRPFLKKEQINCRLRP